MTEASHSDTLKKLVWFMIGLAILGTVIALAWYFAVELPTIQPPVNAHPPLVF